ncbi:MAG TPA: hypothetical protein VK034_10290 [Enhygromyxa sp.]|nr:hypothetical protein [Enhygromyxa sp.]
MLGVAGDLSAGFREIRQTLAVFEQLDDGGPASVHPGKLDMLDVFDHRLAVFVSVDDTGCTIAIPDCPAQRQIEIFHLRLAADPRDVLELAGFDRVRGAPHGLGDHELPTRSLADVRSHVGPPTRVLQAIGGQLGVGASLELVGEVAQLRRSLRVVRRPADRR